MINVEQNDLSDASVSHGQGDTFVTLSCVTVHVYIFFFYIASLMMDQSESKHARKKRNTKNQSIYCIINLPG